MVEDREVDADEARRLSALDSYAILDTPSEPGFDGIVILASQICQAPVALVSLVAADRQWFKARAGFDGCETPLDVSICRHALDRPGLLVIPDLADDPRTRHNALVTGEPFIRFYAGARLETGEGLALGTLCVIDTKPRPEGLSGAQATALAVLADQVMSQMELRRALLARDAAQQAVREGDVRQRQILESAIDFAIIATDRYGLVTDWNTGAERIFGWTFDEMRGEPTDRFFTPEDRATDRPGYEMRRTLKDGRGNDERWHLRKDGSLFWANGEMMPLRNEAGQHIGFIKIVRDETLRREAVEKLRVSEEFLQGVLASSDDCIQVLDLDGNLVFMSEGGRRSMEVADFEALRGRRWPVLCPDDLRATANASVEVAKAGGTGHYQGRTDTFAGTPKWWDVRVTPILDGDGRPEKLLAISRDITAGHQAEARRLAVLELGDRLRDLTDTGDMAFVAAEVMGRTLDASRAGYGTVSLAGEVITIARDWTVTGVASIAGMHSFRTYGTFVEELKRGSIVLIDDTECDPRTAAKSDALDAIGVRSVVNLPIFEYGKFVAMFYLHDDTARHWDDEQIAFVRNVADRTRAAIERRLAEDRLRDLNADLERRVEEQTRDRDRVWRNSQDLLVVIDRRGVFRSVSPVAEKMLGWSPDEMLGLTVFDFVHPDDLPTTGGALDKAKGEELPTYLNRYRRKDGTYRWMSWVAAPEVDLIYAYGRDVTAEKEKTDALHVAEEQLRQAQKMEAVGQLTGGVAHDFNNLLTVIRSSVDLLKRPDLSEERRQRYVQAISDTTARASKLTGQLLAFARRQTLKPEVFDVVRSVGAIRDMVGTLTGSGVRIETSVPDRPCFVHADPSQFDTALVNLAVNARDAMDGEGQLTILMTTTTSIPSTRSQPAVEGDFVVVAVSDTGSGIADADLERIFDPFFTTKGVGQGTGLGLSQVIGFVKQSGGDVAVESEVDRGTTFSLYLPRTSEPRDAVATAAAPEGLVDGHGVYVLVVEDNEDVGSFAALSLQELGYQTLLAANAEDALAMLAGDPDRFGVVFSDVVMPGMNGIELGQEIRRLHPRLPVVLTSGYSHVLAQNGTFGFELLQKPYSIEDLSRVFHKAVG